jgi:hypothetical protein
MRRSDHTRAGGLVFGHWYHASRMPVTNKNMAPSSQEGCGTIWIVTWNIVDRRGGRITQAAARMAQMGMGEAVLTVTNIVDNWYPKSTTKYTLMCSKVARCTQGGVALMWKEDKLKFEVELVLLSNGLNILTFQLITGDKGFYIVGAYIPPNYTRGVEDLRRVVEECPAGCKLLVIGDLNINVGFPQDEQEEVIVDLLDKTNLVNTSRGYWLRTPCRTNTKARWTWSQKRGMMQYYSHLDYILAHVTVSFF